jgi:glycosyltransferase involved in cell wall biosynthesis
LLQALRTVVTEAPEPQVRLLIAGPVNQGDREMIDRCGLTSHVRHLGILDRGEALALQRSADALVLLTDSLSSAPGAKIFEYLGAQRPIVALADRSEAARIIRETNTGVVVPPGDVEAIRGALHLAISGDLQRRYSPRNLDRYTYPRPAHQMATVIEEAIARRNAR